MSDDDRSATQEQDADRDPPDRLAVIKALVEAATALGWRVSSSESLDWRVTLVVIPPLARSHPTRNHWPDEPAEREEPSQEERTREFAPDWDVDPRQPAMARVRQDGAPPILPGVDPTVEGDDDGA